MRVAQGQPIQNLDARKHRAMIYIRDHYKWEKDIVMVTRRTQEMGAYDETGYMKRGDTTQVFASDLATPIEKYKSLTDLINAGWKPEV